MRDGPTSSPVERAEASRGPGRSWRNTGFGCGRYAVRPRACQALMPIPSDRPQFAHQLRDGPGLIHGQVECQARGYLPLSGPRDG